MVSGLVTSPLDHDRICLEDARPISMASKLLMSIKVGSPPRGVRPRVLMSSFGVRPLLTVRCAHFSADRSLHSLFARGFQRLGVDRLGVARSVGVGRAGGVGVVGALRALVGRLAVGGTDAGEVDAQL